MLNSSYQPERQNELISIAERYLADSIALNELYPNNHLALASNVETFGEIEMRKQNYEAAKTNFEKSQEIRKAYYEENPGPNNSLEKERA